MVGTSYLQFVHPDEVKELPDAVTATRKFTVHLDTAAVADLEVSHEVHLAVYHILQEHLTNMLKHARAGQVSVTVDTGGSCAPTCDR